MARRIKRKFIKNILSVIVLIISLLAIIQVLKLNVLPDKYLSLFLIGELAIFLLAFILFNIRKKVLIIIGLILYIFISLGNIIGYYYISKVNSYISSSFDKDYYKIETEYYLVASKDNDVEDIDELKKSAKIDYYKYSRSIDKALKDLGKYKYTAIDTPIDSMKNILNTNNFLLITKANYDYLFENTKDDVLNKGDYKVIYEFKVTDYVKTNTATPDSYNIYINGLDFTGMMRDYNLIATVNTKTRKVLLTSIPRDYYVDVPGYGMKDTLMCMGSLDPEVSKEALEKLFGIQIDYTINLNTSSLVDIVDALGGVEFCSEMNFRTTHALVLNTYDDTKGKTLYVKKGCDTYNGIEMLTIARERNAFPGRDRYRQKNCRQILINIIKKLASTTTLTNYNEVINSFDGLYTTDMNGKTIKKLVKVGLENTNFKIEEQSVDGTDKIGLGHLGTQEASIMEPGMDTVYAATKKIKAVLKGK